MNKEEAQKIVAQALRAKDEESLELAFRRIQKAGFSKEDLLTFEMEDLDESSAQYWNEIV